MSEEIKIGGFSSQPDGSEGIFAASADKTEVQEEEAAGNLGGFFDWAVKIGLYALAFLIPLFFLPFTSDVLEFNKQFLLLVASAVLLIFWLAKVLVTRKIEIRKSLVNIFIVLFLASVLVSSLLGGNIYQALVGFGGVISESFIVLVCLAIVYFLASNGFKDKKEISTLFFSLLASALVAGILGFLQLAGKFVLPWDFAQTAGFNTLGSVNSLEIFLAAMLVMTVTLFTDRSRPTWQLVTLAVASVLMLFIMISFNFLNVWWILIGIMTLVVGVGIVRQGRASQTRLILAMVVLAIALLLSLTKLNISGGWLNIPAEVSPSYSATIEVDKGVLGKNLFFGAGPGSCGSSWELYRSELINQTIFWNVRFSQGISKVVSMPSTVGVVGAGLWLLVMFFFAVWGLFKLFVGKGENWTFAFAFYSGWLFLAAMQFFYPSSLALEFLFWLTLGVSLFLLKELKKDETEKSSDILVAFRKESPLASIFSFLLVIIMVLGISIFYLGARYWYADVLFARGVQASTVAGNLDKSTDLITRATNLNPYRDTYLNSLSQVALLKVGDELAKPQSTQRDANIQQYIAGAINIAKSATDLNPKNPDNWIQRGIVYQNVLGYLTGADDWMINAFTEATRLQPKNPYAFYELGQGYELLSNYTYSQAGQDKDKQAKAADYMNKADEAFSQAVAVKSDYSPAHYQLALIYDAQGKADQAIAKMELTKASYPNDTGVAFQLGLLYYKKQDWSKAQGEFERAITLDTNYSNARYFLGLVYDRNNEKQKAIEQFTKIAQLNPDNQEVQKILANLSAGKAALDGIVPPAASPDQRPGVPVQEKAPVTQ